MQQWLAMYVLYIMKGEKSLPRESLVLVPALQNPRSTCRRRHHAATGQNSAAGRTSAAPARSSRSAWQGPWCRGQSAWAQAVLRKRGGEGAHK